MPPALHRLAASPSAVRSVFSLFPALAVPPPLSTASDYFTRTTTRTRRSHSSVPNGFSRVQRKRWKQTAGQITARDRIRHVLEADAKATFTEEDDDLIMGDGSLDQGGSDAARWAGSLARRERVHGLRGIKDIWALQQYAPNPLPMDDTAHSEFLWGTFIKHPDLVEQVIDHAAQQLLDKGQSYLRLYTQVMTYWLPRDEVLAVQYHKLMLAQLDLETLPLKELAQYGRSSFSLKTYEALLLIYSTSNERDLYDNIIPPLIERKHISMARRWHTLCISRNDLPSESVAAMPVVRILMAGSSLHSPLGAASNNANPDNQKYDQDLLRRLKGRDTAPVRFEDSFCAKMFATRSFSPESIISGLAMVGVNEIGPQAVLAMASRVEPLERLPDIFEELKAFGIALQGCVFSLAVEKFAKERDWPLLRSMLESDQHPDVFDDEEVQRKLLDFYLDQNDYAQVQRTLSILTFFHRDSSQESWNLLLQTHIKRTGSQHVTEVLQDMRIRGIMVTIESIAAIKSLLRRRQMGRKPTLSHNQFDDLRFVTRIFITILMFGLGPISPLTWREIIRRYGMTGRVRELRRLLLWLLCWYAPRSRSQFHNLPDSPLRQPAYDKLRNAYPERNHYFHFPKNVSQGDNERHPIRQLLPPSLQQALIIWGFRAALLSNANLEQSLLGGTLAKKHYRRRLFERQDLRRVDWDIGLRTVSQLRDLGVHVHRDTIVKALQMQFIVLFGRGRSNKKENRVMEDTNHLPYAHYVQQVNKIWGSPLFPEPQLLKSNAIHRYAWHPRLWRDVTRKGSVSLAEVLGPAWLDRGVEGKGRGDGYGDVDGGERDMEKLKRSFEVQDGGMEPGFEWMHEDGVHDSTKRVMGRRTDISHKNRRE